MISALDPWAILGAVATGLAITFGLGLLLGLLTILDPRLLRHLTADDLTPEEEEALLDEEVKRTFRQPGLALAIILYAVLVSVLTGFLAARWAETAPLLNAGAAGVLSMLVAALLDRLEGEPGNGFPLWMTVLGYILTLPAALLGGWLHLLSLSLAGAG